MYPRGRWILPTQNPVVRSDSTQRDKSAVALNGDDLTLWGKDKGGAVQPSTKAFVVGANAEMLRVASL